MILSNPTFKSHQSGPVQREQKQSRPDVWVRWAWLSWALALYRAIGLMYNDSCVPIICTKWPGDGLVWQEAHMRSISETGQLSRSTLKRKGPLQTKAASEKPQWAGLQHLKVLYILKVKWLFLKSKAHLPFLCFQLLLTKAKFRRKDWVAPCGLLTSVVLIPLTGSEDPSSGELLWTEQWEGTGTCHTLLESSLSIPSL